MTGSKSSARTSVDPVKSELEDAERQERLRKWLPLLWLGPVALILLLVLIAYFAR